MLSFILDKTDPQLKMMTVMMAANPNSWYISTWPIPYNDNGIQRSKDNDTYLWWLSTLQKRMPYKDKDKDCIKDYQPCKDDVMTTNLAKTDPSSLWNVGEVIALGAGL